MSLCDSIDTLAMAYLDDELAPEERRELEHHTVDCASCKAHIDAERSELAMVRGALTAPRAPDLLRAKVGRALDGEDRAQRAQWTRYLLPGSSIAAAAAAIAVFVAVHPAGPQVSTVATDAVRQQARTLPLEVQGASTGAWLRQHFEPTMEVPQFHEPTSRVIGARLLPHGINGHDAARIEYQLDFGAGPFTLTAIMVRDVRDDDLADGDEVRIGDRKLHVVDIDGRTGVTFIDANHIGYLFISPELSENDLINLVAHTEFQ
jgi:anti-sigma factor RsiW